MEIFIIVVLIFLSAFFSASETAISSVNKIKLKAEQNMGNKKATTVLRLSDNFKMTLSTILVGNNVVNIGLASIATVLFTTHFGPSLGPALSTAAMTILLLIFGEILPKSYAKANSLKVSLLLSGAVSFAMTILKPFAIIFSKLSDIFVKEDDEAQPTVTEEDLKQIIEETALEGVLDKEEADLVHSALVFSDTTAREILTPRVDLDACDIAGDYEEIRTLFLETNYSRIPVYDDNIDNIIGIVFKSDFFKEAHRQNGNPFSVRLLVKPVLYIPSSVKIRSLMSMFRRDNTHIAVVTDEHGGTMGIVSLEDILEELVGEIYDEHDKLTGDIIKEEDGFIVPGDFSLEDILKEFSSQDGDPDTDAVTVGGFVGDLLSKIPDEGDKLDYKDLTFEVLSVKERRVLSVKVSRNSDD